MTTEGSLEFVPPDERVAVFDNDGTLWCEKPMPIELGFVLKRLAAMAERDQTLRDRQPWKAANGKDDHEGRHPTLGHRFRDCGYRPMIDLLDIRNDWSTVFDG